MALLIIFLVLAVVVGFALTLAVGWIVVVPVLIALGFAIWGGFALAKGGSPSDVLRTPRPELRGPGGPDEPDAVR